MELILRDIFMVEKGDNTISNSRVDTCSKCGDYMLNTLIEEECSPLLEVMIIPS